MIANWSNIVAVARSALDDASIRKALARLLPGHETFNLYHSALGRSAPTG